MRFEDVVARASKAENEPCQSFSFDIFTSQSTLAMPPRLSLRASSIRKLLVTNPVSAECQFMQVHNL